jgi:plastocyanin
MLLRLAGVVLVLAVVGAAATSAGAQNMSVTATASNQFTPSDVTVNVGEMVTWSNVGGQNHNVVFDDGSFTEPSPPSTSNWTVSRTFGVVGNFTYYCEIHGDPGGQGMSGIVRVVEQPPPPGGTPPAPAPPGGNLPGGNPPSGPGAPGPEGEALAVTLKFSDATPLAGKRVRVFGVVKPARDGRKVAIQKRLRNGRYKTIATTRLKAAPGDKSVYALRLRLAADTVLRARVAGDDEAATGLSKRRKLDVHRPA